MMIVAVPVASVLAMSPTSLWFVLLEIPEYFLEICTKQTECHNAINKLLPLKGKSLHQEGQSQNSSNLDLPNYIIIRTRYLPLAPFTIVTFYGPLFFCWHFNLGSVALY